MSFVDLKNDVKFDCESHDFTLEYNDKVFTSKSYAGVIKQKEDHCEMLNQRELLKADLVEVKCLQDMKDYLYHQEKKHLYKVNVHGLLDRVKHDSLAYMKRDYFLTSNKASISGQLLLIESLNDKIESLNKGLNAMQLKLKESCVQVSNYKKGINP